MGQKVIRIPGPSSKPVILEAEPEWIEIDLARTGIIVVDMTNSAFRPSGYADSIGWKRVPEGIEERIKKINSAARATGVKVIYIAHRYSPDLLETGGPTSPNWYKDYNLILYREHPEWRDRVTIKGAWGGEIIDEIKPQEGDIIVEKQRYSCFVGTNLDSILKTCNIKYLVFTGVGTSICVDAGLRDAFYHDYFPILISDAAATGGPLSVHEATIWNVEHCYGWVTTAENVIKAME